jgi:hypothetical protein
MIIKKFLKKVLPIKVQWFICNILPKKLFLADIADTERLVEYPWVYARLPKSGRILDIGSSGSYFTHSLASLGYDVYALDKKIVKPTHPDIKIVKKYIEEYETDIRFDAITCISTLEHIAIDSDYKECVNKLMTLLKPNGSLFITVPCGKPKMLPGYKVFSIDDMPLGDYFKKDGKVWNKATEEQIVDIDMNQEDGVLSIICVEIKNV